MNIRQERTNCNVENVYDALVQTTQNAYEPNEGAVNPAEELKKMRETRFAKKPSMKQMAEDLGFAGASSYQRYEKATEWENRYFPPELVQKLIELWRGQGNPPIDSYEILRLGNLHQFVIKENEEPILLPGVRGETISRELPLLTVEQVEMFSSGALLKERKEKYLYQKGELGPRAFRLVVTDRSMEPVFREGDELICDPDGQVEPGDYVISKLDSEAVSSIRQYRLLGYDGQSDPIAELMPSNPNYPRVKMSADAPGQIYAVVRKYTRAVK